MITVKGQIMKYLKTKSGIYSKFGADDTSLVTACIEDPLVEKWFDLVDDQSDKPRRHEYEIEDTKLVSIDGGGMCFVNEPSSSVTVDGIDYETMLRQIEMFLPALRDKQNHKILGDFIGLPGRWIRILLTVDTGLKVATAFQSDLQARQSEIDAIWDRYKETTDAIQSTGKARFPSRAQMHANNPLSPILSD